MIFETSDTIQYNLSSLEVNIYKCNVSVINNIRKLSSYLRTYDGIVYIPTNKWKYDTEFLMKDTPQDDSNSKEGTFKVYLRKDDNIDLVINTNGKTLAWYIDIENDEEALKIVDVFLHTPFEGGRHVNRINLL